MTTTDQRELIRQLPSIETTLSVGVGISLGMWAGLGDWRCLSEPGRTRAGLAALSDLDTVIARLTALRADLAGQLDPPATP